MNQFNHSLNALLPAADGKQVHEKNKVLTATLQAQSLEVVGLPAYNEQDQAIEWQIAEAELILLYKMSYYLKVSANKITKANLVCTMPLEDSKAPFMFYAVLHQYQNGVHIQSYETHLHPAEHQVSIEFKDLGTTDRPTPKTLAVVDFDDVNQVKITAYVADVFDKQAQAND